MNRMNLPVFLRLFLLFGLCSSWAATSYAATSQAVRDDSFQDFQQGELEGTGLSSDGFLFPAYEREELGDTGAQIVWSVLDQGERGILAATGHEGQLVRVKPDGNPEILARLDDPELTAIADLGDGSALIAGAPSGNLYRLSTDDELTTYGHVDAKFVWDMERDNAGNIWIATGTEGRLFRLDPGAGGEAELEGELPSSNLLDIWIDEEGLMGEPGLVYVGSQDPAWLYRFKSGWEEAEVVFDGGAGEIRSLQPLEEGLAIALNTERAPTAEALNLTLRMNDGAQAQRQNVPGQPNGAAGAAGGDAAAPTEKEDLGDVFATAEKAQGQAFSMAVLVTPEGYARSLFTSPERPIHSLASAENGNLLAAAGNNGRIFEVTSPQDYAVVADLQEDFVVSMRPQSDSWLLACARNGVVYRFDDAPADEALYRSRVIDAGGPVDWGNFYWRGNLGEDDTVYVSFRTGNSDNPRRGNWGEWSAETAIQNDTGVQIAERPYRYLQYRLRFEPSGGDSVPRTDYTEAFYRHQNQPPVIQKVSVTETGAGATAAAAENNNGQNGNANKQNDAGSSPQGGGREAHSNTGVITVSWSAADPNQDTLLYTLLFKGEEETEWKLIEEEMRTTEMPLTVRGVADGRYRFKVVASDALNNPPGRALEVEQTSEEIIVDNTPPQIQGLTVTETGDGRGRLSFTAVDNLSLVSTIEADIDNGDPFPIYPQDGLLDETREEVEWETPQLEPGEHVITVAVTDRRGNTGVAKGIFQITE